MFLPELNIQLITTEELTDEQIEFFYDTVSNYVEIVPFSSLDVDGEHITDNEVIVFEQGNYNIYAMALSSTIINHGKSLIKDLSEKFDFDFSLDISE